MAWPIELTISIISAILWIAVYVGSLGDAKKASEDSKEFINSIKNKEDV